MNALGPDVPYKVAAFLFVLGFLLLLSHLDARAEARRRHPSSRGRRDG